MFQPLTVLGESTLLKRTTSRCPACTRPIPAEVFQRDGRVVMAKTCPAHGRFEVTLANDPRFYHVSCGSSCGCEGRAAVEPGPDPFEVLSTCVALIEIVDSCNLTCPTCYAASPWGVGDDVDCITFDEFAGRVQAVVDRKGFIDILQLSGGEPTIHPDFFGILEWSLAHDQIGYVLINTNAVRIAKDRDFRQRLGAMRSRREGFELYLQFDGTQRAGQTELRGADLREVRRAAIDLVGALGVPTTLTMVVTPGTLPYLGDAVRFGLARPHCRGIAFQPMFTSGRAPAVESSLPIAPETPSPISVGDDRLRPVPLRPRVHARRDAHRRAAHRLSRDRTRDRRVRGLPVRSAPPGDQPSSPDAIRSCFFCALRSAGSLYSNRAFRWRSGIMAI